LGRIRRWVAEERGLVGVQAIGAGTVEAFEKPIELMFELLDAAALRLHLRQQFADDPLQEGRGVRQAV
jgi:stage V sporulation protein SpoVS